MVRHQSGKLATGNRHERSTRSVSVMTKFQNLNKEKSRQLGMPFGTANARLRKAIMFMLAKKAKLDRCFRCGKRIRTVDEFSIDHKQDWMHGDPALFWETENIAFSHRRCNIQAARRLPKKFPETATKAWCSGCKTYHVHSAFARWTGRKERTRQPYCKKFKNKGACPSG